MASPFLAIADAIKERLLEDPPIAGDRVFRGRRVIKHAINTAIAVRLERTKAELAGVGRSAPKDWTTLYGVECSARSEPGVIEAEDAVDAVLVAAYARLSGWAPDGLAVEDVFTEPAIVWDVAQGEDRAITATFVVAVVHRTTANALVAWPN